VALPGEALALWSAERGCRPSSGTDEFETYARDVYALQPVRRGAGVFPGLNSDKTFWIPATHSPCGAVGFSFLRTGFSFLLHCEGAAD
jgi:hypothetical protein